jgi:arylsulfatase A-like enzyme
MVMWRRDFLKTATVLAASPAAWTAPSRKPNVLFLVTSGWRTQALETDGDSDLRTPNLELLARQGARCNRVYASCPTGSPSRAALLTGRSPYASGVTRDDVRLPAGEPSIAEQLKTAGYDTGFIGQWLLDGAEDPGFVPPGPRRHGFQYWAAFNRGYRYFESVYFCDKPEPIRAEGFEADYQTALAIDFIKQKRQNPFCLFLAWGPPHPPWTPPPGAWKPATVQLRANVASGYDSANLAAYYALCSALDVNAGRLMRALEEQHLTNDTILVFTSDYGEMLGSHGLEGASVPFEEAVRVPLIIRYPRQIAAASKQDFPISNADVMPTLLGLCGVPIPDETQGQDRSTLLTSGTGAHPQSVYSLGKIGSAAEWRMVVRALDKLVVDRDLNVTHLYNLGTDPFEMENLAQDASQQLKRDALTALLKDWMRRTADRTDPSGLKKRPLNPRHEWQRLP